MAKRMSADEKRKVILDIYHKTKSVFVEKEILTLASKAGVNANTVADINQGLIDDGLVDKEKIGGSNYFWSFPAKKDRLDQIRHAQALEHIASLKTKIDEAQAALQDAKRGREDDTNESSSALAAVGETMDATTMNTGDTVAPADGASDDTTMEDVGDTAVVAIPPRMTRASKLQRLEEISKQRAAAIAELETLKENDPQALADLGKELSLVHQAANRWTDNIFNCQSYLIKKRGMDKKEALKILGTTSTFDYPDDKIPK